MVKKMSQKTFTERELKHLRKNPYVKKVSEKAITYHEEFKHFFISQIEDGKTPRMIFEQAGFEVDVIGMKRIEAAASRWKKAYKTSGVSGLKDTRQTKSGRRLNRMLTEKEQTAKLEAKIKLLEAENELLKKVYLMERGLLK